MNPPQFLIPQNAPNFDEHRRCIAKTSHESISDLRRRSRKGRGDAERGGHEGRHGTRGKGTRRRGEAEDTGTRGGGDAETVRGLERRRSSGVAIPQQAAQSEMWGMKMINKLSKVRHMKSRVMARVLGLILIYLFASTHLPLFAAPTIGDFAPSPFLRVTASPVQGLSIAWLRRLSGVRTEVITYSDLVWQLALQPAHRWCRQFSRPNRALRLVIDQRLICKKLRSCRPLLQR